MFSALPNPLLLPTSMTQLPLIQEWLHDYQELS